ncbi:MAG: efflux RND transporter periplasmic adaptor subunit [Verrucomicrobia bacterium]|nr:efflux RND transporter periplasmic adaptor subunit [Verrucomicrobiota bacterium]
MKKTFGMCFLRSSFSLLAVIMVLALGGCGRKDTAQRVAPPVPVQVSKAVKQALPVTLKAIGTVQALRGVAVKSQVDGIIKSVNFREGDEVKAGDLLVTLDRRPFENSLQMAKADLANARAQAARAATEAERYERLDQALVVSKEQYAQLVTQAATTKAQVDAKEAAVANSQLQLGYTEIRAPIDGRTGQLNLHEGALVKANDGVFSLVTINQLSPISVAFAVPERVLDAVRVAFAKEGIAVHVAGRDDDDVQADGVLDFIDNTVDPTTGMITLKARFTNEGHALWPGRFVNVEVRLGSEADQIVVPTPAVQTGQKGRQVFVVKADKTVDLRQVVVGRTVGELTSLVSGVSEGETVVTDGQLRLVPGSRIEVRTLEEAAQPRAAVKK